MFRFTLSPKRLLGVGAAVLVALLGVLVAPAVTAQADTGDITMRIYPNNNPFVYLGVSESSTGAGAPVIQWSLSGAEQVWTRHQVSPGAFEFVNKNSGLCMFADGVAGDWIYQEPCNGSQPELFATNLPGSGSQVYSVQSLYRTNLYWDIDGGSPNQGTHLIQWYWNGGNNQYFGALGAS